MTTAEPAHIYWGLLTSTSRTDATRKHNRYVRFSTRIRLLKDLSKTAATLHQSSELFEDQCGRFEDPVSHRCNTRIPSCGFEVIERAQPDNEFVRCCTLGVRATRSLVPGEL